VVSQLYLCGAARTIHRWDKVVFSLTFSVAGSIRPIRPVPFQTATAVAPATIKTANMQVISLAIAGLDLTVF
jgi:hypothetical protein